MALYRYTLNNNENVTVFDPVITAAENWTILSIFYTSLGVWTMF